MPTIELTDEQAEALRDFLQLEVDRLTWLIGDSTAGDDIVDAIRHSVIMSILYRMEID